MAKPKSQKPKSQKAEKTATSAAEATPVAGSTRDNAVQTRILLKNIIDPPKYLIARDSLGNLDELQSSMKRDGQIHNLVVRPSKKAGVYELLCGHRRRAAMTANKMKDAAVTIRTDLTDDDRALGFIASENSGDSRFDLAPMEQAKVFKRLFDSFGGDSSAAGKVAKYCATTSNNVRRTMGLLEVPKDVRELIETGVVSKDAGIQFNRIADEKTKSHIRQGLVAGTIKTAPQIERAASDFINEQRAKGVKVDKPKDGRRVEAPKGSRSKSEINTLVDDLVWAYGVASGQIKDPTKTFDKIRNNEQATAVLGGQLSILWWMSMELQDSDAKPVDAGSKRFKEYASTALSELLAAQGQELDENGAEIPAEAPSSQSASKKARKEKKAAKKAAKKIVEDQPDDPADLDEDQTPLDDETVDTEPDEDAMSSADEEEAAYEGVD